MVSREPFLGIATEDGGIVYFAKEIKATKIKKEEFNYDFEKKKVFTLNEFKNKIEKNMPILSGEKTYITTSLDGFNRILSY